MYHKVLPLSINITTSLDKSLFIFDRIYNLFAFT